MTTTAPYLSEAAIRAIFEQQLANAPRMAITTARQRLEKIKKIEDWIENETNVRTLSEAMHQDFRKSSFEVWATEVGIVKQAVVAVRRELRHWMQDEPVDGSLALAGMSSWIRYEAKGVCLIIAPWNYPFNLSIMPLVYALAAGNTVVLKPSELTPHTSAVISTMLGDLFPPEEVAVVEGDAETAQALAATAFPSHLLHRQPRRRQNRDGRSSPAPHIRHPRTRRQVARRPR
jgi:aldehyde dehydrogenase (NAD+)